MEVRFPVNISSRAVSFTANRLRPLRNLSSTKRCGSSTDGQRLLWCYRSEEIRCSSSGFLLSQPKTRFFSLTWTASVTETKGFCVPDQLQGSIWCLHKAPITQRRHVLPFFTAYSWNRNNLRGKLGSLEVISSLMPEMHGPYFLIAPIHFSFSCYRWFAVLQREEGSRGSFCSFRCLRNQYFSALQGFLSLPTPAGRRCSLQRSKLLSAHSDWLGSITAPALAKRVRSAQERWCLTVTHKYGRYRGSI